MTQAKANATLRFGSRLGEYRLQKKIDRGIGTLGYTAPERARDKPSTRSDVFSIGLVAYRVLAGQWPEYPFQWPFPDGTNLRRRVHGDLIGVIQKSVAFYPKHRDGNALAMQ